jgi:hypothetical protein
VPVALFDGAPDVRGHHASLPPDVQREPVGVQHHPGDLGVAGEPAGRRGGDRRPEPGRGGARAGGRVQEVADVDGDDDPRLDRAHPRQRSRRQRVVGQLDQRVGLLLGAAAVITLGPGGLQDRLDRGPHLLEAHPIQVEAARAAAIGVPDQGQPAALGGACPQISRSP